MNILESQREMIVGMAGDITRCNGLVHKWDATHRVLVDQINK